MSSTTWSTLGGDPPLVIAHRGASRYLPGHTLEAYELGIDQGADYIEPDLVMTRDHVLVCRHDRYLGPTTDVEAHPEFVGRKTRKNGRADWWVEDFTLAELETLRTRQSNPRRSSEHDGRYAIPTFDRVIGLARDRSAETGRLIGIYPELKHPAAFAALGMDIGSGLVAALEKAGWTSADAPVIIQSFERAALEALDGRVEVPRVQLTLPVTSEGSDVAGESVIPLETLAAYADGVGPSKRLIVRDDGTVTDFISRAHALGLLVHVWTMTGDEVSPDGLSPEDEIRRMYDLGVDAVFADDPALAVRIRSDRGEAERFEADGNEPGGP